MDEISKKTTDPELAAAMEERRSQNTVDPRLAQQIRTPRTTDDQVKEDLRQQELRNRHTVELIIEHTGGPLRLKHKDVLALQNQFMTMTQVAIALELQLKAAVDVLAAQEKELEKLRKQPGQIWTP